MIVTGGLGLEALDTGHLDGVVELLAYSFGRSGDDDRAADYGLAAAENAQQRWARAEALAFFEHMLRLTSMPDSEPNRLRRLDAHVKQAKLI